MQNSLYDYLVVGLGETGFSCVRYLMAQRQSVVVADTRAHPPRLLDCQKHFPQVPIHLGEFSDPIFLSAKTIVVSPGVALSEPCLARCIQQCIPVIGDIELFAREAKAPIIAITGSNGKSTLVTLMGELIHDAGLTAVVCGNIGFPVLDTLQSSVPDYYVVELSSFQLETTFSLHAKLAVVINISPDHLDRHPSEADYLAAKKRVYQHCEYAFLNIDEPHIWQDLSFQHMPIRFTLQTPQQHDWGLQENYLSLGKEKLISTDELYLQGRHQYQNILIALAMGNVLRLPMHTMLNTVRHFKGLPHRCQLIRTKNSVRWINDSKATNVGAAVAALHSVGQPLSDGKIILIAGGDSKGVALDDLKLPVRQYVSHVIVFGKDAVKLANTLSDCASIVSVDDMPAAVKKARALAKPGDIVLLSPACSSLDRYKSYAARGDDFVQQVKTLI